MQPTAASTFPEELQTRLQYFDDGDVTLHDALADILRDDEDTDNNPSGYWRARKAITCIARVSILFHVEYDSCTSNIGAWIELFMSCFLI